MHTPIKLISPAIFLFVQVMGFKILKKIKFETDLSLHYNEPHVNSEICNFVLCRVTYAPICLDRLSKDHME